MKLFALFVAYTLQNEQNRQNEAVFTLQSMVKLGTMKNIVYLKLYRAYF